jgi:PAS domain S-box-containing protein
MATPPREPDGRSLDARVRELRCLLRVSSLLAERTTPFPDLVQQLLTIVPLAYQHAAIARVRIQIGERTWQPADYRDTRWEQTAVIGTLARRVGAIRVCYLAQRPEQAEGPFLEEERELLEAVSEMLAQRVERERTVDALRVNEQRLETVLSSAPIMLFSIDPEGTLSFARGRIKEGLGVPAPGLVGSSVRELADRMPDLRVLFAQALAGNESAADIAWENRVFDARFSPVTDASGVVRSVTGVLTDITDRVRAERALRHSNAQLEELFHGVSFPIASFDRELHYVRVNRAFAQALGQPVEAFAGRSLGDGGLDPQLAAILRRVLADGVPYFEQERPLRFARGGETAGFWDLDIIPLGADQPPPFGLVIVLVDRTARRHAMLELERLASHLQDLREEERRALAREVHDEIGGLLTALRMELSFLSDSPTRVRAEKVVDEGIALVRRISSSLRPQVLDDLGLVPAVQWLAADFRRRAKMRCDVSVPEGDPRVEREIATAAFRILQEALTNISRHARASRVAVDLRISADALELAIDDNGRGISPEEAAGAGTFGLLGMRERVARFGGEVTVTGVARRGTHIGVRIPREGRAS